MKKCIPIIPAFLFSFVLAAQKQTGTNNDFCGALKKILSHSPNNFKSLAGNSYQSIRDANCNEIANARNASVKLPGAIATYIENDMNSDVQFVAMFGSYKTKDLARKKYEELKPKLAVCLKNFTILEPLSKESYQLLEKKVDNNSAKKVSLGLNQPNERINKYSVFVYVFGLGKEPMTNNNNSASQERDKVDSLFAKVNKNLEIFDKPLTSTKDTLKGLASQLKQLVVFGKPDFASITKEQKNTSGKGGMAGILFGKDDYTRYATSFQLEDAKAQEILHSDKGWQFVAYYKDDKRYDQQPMFREMDEKLRKELSNSYTFEDDYDEEGIEKKVHILAKGNSLRLATLIYTEIISKWEPLECRVRITVYANK